MNRTYDVCLVTTGHLSTNPRLVKEMHALRDAGYSVRVVACRFLTWADAADVNVDISGIDFSYHSFGEYAGRLRRNWTRIAQRVANVVLVVSPSSLRPWLHHTAVHPAANMLRRGVCRVRAKLYIAHNIAALPAAWAASRKHNAVLGFDAEDFHSGEFAPSHHSAVRNHVAALEEHYMTRCSYLTAASEGIAGRYASQLNVQVPTTILNVFPLSEREIRIAANDLRDERPTGRVSLYWFSQTIGPHRGLELVVDSLAELPYDFHLTLRGNWADGYRDKLLRRAGSRGLADRIHHRPPCPSREMVVRAAAHDIGLALEIPHCVNRDICVTNKLFTYLTAGIPCLLTNTTGQAPFAARIPDAVRLVDHRSPAEATQAILSLSNRIEEFKSAALAAGSEYSWEREQQKFLRIVSEFLAR